MSDTERYLVVSQGSIGRRHLSNLRLQRPRALIAVLRLSVSGAESPKPAEADLQFTRMEAALEFKPRAAIIASPATAHLANATDLAGIGTHLLIEKPIAAALAGVREFLEDCAERGIIVMPAYNLRFLPSLIETRRLLCEGAIGSVSAVRADVGQYLPDWRPGFDYRNCVSAHESLGGGVMLELSHEFDYVYWMLGMPARLVAMAGTYGDLDMDAENAAEIVLQYDDPARLVSIHLDMLQRNPVRRCRIIGSSGTLDWNGIEDEVHITGVAKAQFACPEPCASAGRDQTYVKELAHFLSCVDSGQSPVVDGMDAYNVLRIVDAAKRSVRERRVISLDERHVR